MAPSFNVLPRLPTTRYLLGGKKRLRVETLNDSDMVQESIAGVQPPKTFLVFEYGRLPDLSEPSTLYNQLNKNNKITLDLCRAFLQLCEVCSKCGCINMLYKLASNITALESFFQKIKELIGYVTNCMKKRS